jgi:WD40 repeat protein
VPCDVIARAVSDYWYIVLADAFMRCSCTCVWLYPPSSVRSTAAFVSPCVVLFTCVPHQPSATPPTHRGVSHEPRRRSGPTERTMLHRLPPELLSLCMSFLDVPTLTAARSLSVYLAVCARTTLRSQAYLQHPENLRALRVAVWAESPPSAHRLRGHATLQRVVGLAVDGSTLVSIGSDRMLMLWDLLADHGRPRGPLASLSLPSCPECIALLSSAGLAAVGDERGDVRLVSLHPTLSHGSTWCAHQQHTTALCWAPTRSSSECIAASTFTLVSGGLDRSIRLWQTSGGRTQTPASATGTYLLAHRKSVSSLTAVPASMCQGTQHVALASFLSSSDDGNIHIWGMSTSGDGGTGAVLLGTLHAFQVVGQLAVDPCGLVAASCESGVVLWDLPTRKRLSGDRGTEGTGLARLAPAAPRRRQKACATFCGSGVLASAGGSSSKQVERRTRETSVWDVSSDAKQPRPLGRWSHMAPVSCIAGGGGLLVCGGTDGALYLWSLPTTLQGLV